MAEQLLARGEGQPPPRHSIECRVYTRRTCLVPTSCQPTSAWGRQDSRWPAVISEISQGGVRLIVKRRFERGVGLGVELPGRDGDDPYTVLARVVHVKGLPDGTWALGCQFISALSEDEIEHLQPPPPPAPAPQPTTGGVSPEARGKKTVSDVILQLQLPSGRVVECCVQRLSVPGPWPVAADKVLTMRVDVPQGPRPTLRLKVVRCHLSGQRWTLRCLLLTPSWEDLLRTIRPVQPSSAGSRNGNR